MNKDTFVNPNTGEEITASTDMTWLWFLCFGQIHTICNGRVGQGLMHALIAVLTGGIAQIYFWFTCRTQARNYYIAKGYVLKHVYDEQKKKEERHERLLEAALLK